MRRLGLCIAGLMIVGSVWAQDQYRLEVLRAEIPVTMAPGEDQPVAVTIANRGTVPWKPDEGFFVAAHWFGPDGAQLIWDGPRTRLPTDVVPGESVDVEVVVSPPDLDGVALVQFDVVQEGVLWVSRRSRAPAALMPVIVKRRYAVSFIEADMPGWSLANSSLQIPVRVRNDGSETWQPGGSFGIAAHWQRPDGTEVMWEGRRTPMPHPVRPGESVSVLVSADVPTGAGSWLVQLDVVHEGVCWFSENAPSPPRSHVVIVLPSCAVGWPAVATTLALALAAFGCARGWWASPRYGRNLDLVWLVATPWLVERTVADIGVRGGFVSLLCLGALAALVGLLPNGLRPFAAWFSGAFLVALLVADRVYLRFFQDLPSVASLAGFGQTDRLGASVKSLVDPGDAALLASGVLGVLVWWAVRPMTVGGAQSPKRLLRAGLTLVWAVLTLVWVARAPVVQQVFRRVFVAQEIGVIGAHLVDAGGWLGRTIARQGLAPSEFEDIEKWFRNRGGERSGSGALFGAARNLNVLMIQAESLQAFVPGLVVEGQEVTPTLNRWVGDSIVFDRVTDQTGQGRSSDAELLTQVSLLPLADGAAAFVAAGNHFTSLAGVLAERGYATLSAVPFDRSFWNRSETHKAYGYQQSLFAEDFAPGETVGWGLSDREFLGRMGRRLADLPEPFCVWLMTLSLHHPFEGFPEELEEMDVGRWRGTPVGAYLHTMRYFDHALADLESELMARGLLDSTMIAVWGDHDAGFEWTPEVAALMGVSADTIGWYVSQRVPLIIRLPASKGLRGRRSDPAGHIDVAPTLAALLGVDPRGMAWMGRNLLGNPGGEPVVGEYDCWMDPEHLFLQGDGTLEGGLCLDGFVFARRPSSECAESFARARQRADVAQSVLRYDLQVDLTAELHQSLP